MACCLGFSAWQHLSSLNTLWNVEKWFGCLYDSGICSGGAVCLFKYSPKRGACFPRISSNCWPKQEDRVSSLSWRDITEAWLSAGRSVINLDQTTVPEPLPKCWAPNQTHSIFIITLLSFYITLSLSQFQIHQSCLKALLYPTDVLMQVVISPCYNIYCQ